MKFIITEEEKNRIKKLYGGLLNEIKNLEIQIEGRQPYPNTDWDMVHGYFGTKRLTDDLEERVSSALLNGNYIVDDVVISTTKEDFSILTKGSVFLRNAQPNETPDKYFTTRGSIGKVGSDYPQRHDAQVNGLVDRLKSYYKSSNVKEFGPFEIYINGTNYAYKQTFFAIQEAGGNRKVTQGNTKNLIQGSDMMDLRNKMKSLTNLSIDPNSFDVDLNNNKISFDSGGTNVKSLSFIYDNLGELDNRLPQILKQNPTMKIAKKGNLGDMSWAILYFQ